MTPEQPGVETPAREKARAPRGAFEAFTQEDLALLYLRQSRTAVVTIAVLAVAGVIASVIIGIVVIIGISHENRMLEHLQQRAAHQLFASHTRPYRGSSISASSS